MTNTTLINYSTRDFANKEQLELYLIRQREAFTPEVIELFTKAGMLRRVVTQIWNKQGSFRVGIIFEYRDKDAFKLVNPCWKNIIFQRWRVLLPKFLATVVW